ncbi:hypothetical protein CL633_01525 [bacterium]|nr:hypothetical protein [bacterium]|tara:strand:+ start:9875 stop:10177 length:303 start_codon:yes stop_codon:yes gene_type:complete
MSIIIYIGIGIAVVAGVVFLVMKKKSNVSQEQGQDGEDFSGKDSSGESTEEPVQAEQPEIVQAPEVSESPIVSETPAQEVSTPETPSANEPAVQETSSQV